MADINVQRKGRSIWPWLLALLLILVLAAAAWWYLNADRGSTEADDLGAAAAPAAPTPAYDPATAPPYPATPMDTTTPGDTIR